MRNHIYLFAIVISITFFTACKNNCKNVLCFNGNCNDGTCICHDGFEGDKCDIIIRDKMLGTYTGKMQCVDSADKNNITIIVSPPDDAGLEAKIWIKVPYSTTTKLCTVKADNTFFYNYSTNAIQYSITGNYKSDTLKYTEELIENGIKTYSCTYEGTKQ